MIKNKFKSLLATAFGTPHPRPISLMKAMMPMKGLSIVLVVLAHATITMLAAELSSPSPPQPLPSLFGIWSIDAPVKSIILELCRCSVPLFLFMSGYFTTMSPRTPRAVHNTCWKLLAPMLTWSLIAFAFSWRNGAGGWDIPTFLVNVVTGKVQLGFFFIVLLVQYYWLSIFFVPLMEKRPGLALGLAASLQALSLVYDYVYLFGKLGIVGVAPWMIRAGAFPEWLFPRFAGYFAFGIWASMRADVFKAFLLKNFKAIAACAAAAALLLVAERGILFNYAYATLDVGIVEATFLSWSEWKVSTTVWSVAATLFLFGLFLRRIPLNSLFGRLGKYTFHILLIHGMTMNVINMFLYKYCSEYNYEALIGVAVLFAAGIAVPVLATKLIQKKAPKIVRDWVIGT